MAEDSDALDIGGTGGRPLGFAVVPMSRFFLFFPRPSQRSPDLSVCNGYLDKCSVLLCHGANALLFSFVPYPDNLDQVGQEWSNPGQGQRGAHSGPVDVLGYGNTIRGVYGSYRGKTTHVRNTDNMTVLRHGTSGREDRPAYHINLPPCPGHAPRSIGRPTDPPIDPSTDRPIHRSTDRPIQRTPLCPSSPHRISKVPKLLEIFRSGKFDKPRQHHVILIRLLLSVYVHQWYTAIPSAET